MPIFAVIGKKEGGDKEKTRVKPAEAELWMEATSSRSRSEVVVLDCDWYVMQDGAATKRVLEKVSDFIKGL